MTAVSTRKVCTGCMSSHDVSADAGATEVCAPATKAGVLTATISEMCSAAAEGGMPATAAKAGGPTAGVATTTAVCATTAAVSSSAAMTSKRADWQQQKGNKGRPKSYMTKHRFLLVVDSRD
jgi:hypothetical protein